MGLSGKFTWRHEWFISGDGFELLVGARRYFSSLEDGQRLKDGLEFVACLVRSGRDREAALICGTSWCRAAASVRRACPHGELPAGAERSAEYRRFGATRLSLEIWLRDQPGAGNPQRHWRLCAPRLERWKKSGLGVHGRGPYGFNGNQFEGRSMGPACRHFGDRQRVQRDHR